MDFTDAIKEWEEKSNQVDNYVHDLLYSLEPSVYREVVEESKKLHYTGRISVKNRVPQITWSLRSNILPDTSQMHHFATVTFRYLGGEAGFHSGYNPLVYPPYESKSWLNYTVQGKNLAQFLTGLHPYPDKSAVEAFLQQIILVLPNVSEDITVCVREKVTSNKDAAAYLFDKMLQWRKWQREGLERIKALEAELKRVKEEQEIEQRTILEGDIVA